MDGLDIGLLSMFAIVVLIYAGMHAAIALCLVSLVGVSRPWHASRSPRRTCDGGGLRWP
jgi:hypothetical protein